MKAFFSDWFGLQTSFFLECFFIQLASFSSLIPLSLPFYKLSSLPVFSTSVLVTYLLCAAYKAMGRSEQRSFWGQGLPGRIRPFQLSPQKPSRAVSTALRAQLLSRLDGNRESKMKVRFVCPHPVGLLPKPKLPLMIARFKRGKTPLQRVAGAFPLRAFWSQWLW